MSGTIGYSSSLDFEGLFDPYPLPLEQVHPPIP